MWGKNARAGEKPETVIGRNGTEKTGARIFDQKSGIEFNCKNSSLIPHVQIWFNVFIYFHENVSEWECVCVRERECKSVWVGALIWLRLKLTWLFGKSPRSIKYSKDTVSSLTGSPYSNSNRKASPWSLSSSWIWTRLVAALANFWPRQHGSILSFY